MTSSRSSHRLSFVVLCFVPFLTFVVVAAHALRIPGVHQAIGVAYIVMIAVAAWKLGARALRTAAPVPRLLALAGALLISPFALVSLLWIGLGGPWQATVPENQMRYLVLMVMGAAIVTGFVVLREALREAGERFYSTLGFTPILLSGPIYLIWNAFAWGVYFGKEHTGQVPQAILSLDPTLDVILDLGVLLTYLATAAFAVSLGKVGWLGRGAARAYLGVCLVAIVFLMIRGLAYPDPRALSTPWYTNPGFIVGIPAVPYIMPFLLGVVLLRRAGEQQDQD